jgi:hypothetical protein
MIALIALCVVAMVVFMALRSFFLWYFKIDERIELLREIRDRLPAIKVQSAAKPPISAPGAAEKWAARLLRV